MQENKFGRVWVEKVFRGRSYGEFELSHTTYKNDFKLVPKDQEEIYHSKTLVAEKVDSLRKPLPEYLQFPPLLQVTYNCENKAKSVITFCFETGDDKTDRKH